jgi:8-oxo-dGTP pyrophosphatase MutT (NUDIX family)
VEELSPRLLDFDPARDPALPRDAATIAVVRDASARLEVFCVRRSAKSSFLGGALVFPGGKVDVSDASPAWEGLAGDPDERARELASDGASARALCIAACR